MQAEAPVLVNSLKNTFVIPGKDTTLTAGFKGTVSRYEWYRNDVLIPNETSSNLYLKHFQTIELECISWLHTTEKTEVGQAKSLSRLIHSIVCGRLSEKSFSNAITFLFGIT